MVKKNYTSVGTCIWCKRTMSDATFYTAPHIAPQSLGYDEIGVDVCDSCNHYFGTANAGEPNTNVIFAEIFKCIKLFSHKRYANSWREFRSTYFEYRHSERVIKLKRIFNCRIMTKQFKRSLYEVFLQQYHKKTLLGLDPQFDYVRNYARFGKGDMQVYYIQSEMILAPDISRDKFAILGVDDIEEFGYYHLNIMGHMFFLEVNTVRATLMRDIYLSKCVNMFYRPFMGGAGLIKVDDVRNIDFLMNRWNSIKVETNNKLIEQKQLYI